MPTVSLTLSVLPSGDWLIDGAFYVHDRPGELAHLCTAIAIQEATIERFYYNRSENSAVVSVRTRVPSAARAGLLADDLHQAGRLGPAPDQREEVAEITDPGGLLRLKVNIEHRCGALAAFAALLKDHHANVLYLSYDAREQRGLVEMAMATESPDEVSALLGDLNLNR